MKRKTKTSPKKSTKTKTKQKATPKPAEPIVAQETAEEKGAPLDRFSVNVYVGKNITLLFEATSY